MTSCEALSFEGGAVFSGCGVGVAVSMWLTSIQWRRIALCEFMSR